MPLDISALAPSQPAAQAFLARGDHPMLLGDRWVPSASGQWMQAVNPATGEVLGRFPDGDATDADRAVAVARAAFGSGAWAGLTPSARAKVLWRAAELIEQHIDELAELETLDQGKPYWVGRYAEIPGAAEQFRFFAGQAQRIEGQTLPTSINYQPAGKQLFAYTMKQPVGVVAAIVPWNSPLVLTAMKLAPALAAGCCVVLKPAEDTSLTALRLGELLCEAGLPPGVLNIVTGRGDVVGAALAAHPDVDKISFTGSTAVGRAVLAAAGGNLKKVTLELGGKSPVVVMPDADIDAAIEGAANAIFFNSGQVCVAGSRLYVHREVFDRVVHGVAEIARGLKLGHGLDPATKIGPLVSPKQAQRVHRYVQQALADGAEALAGGNPEGPLGPHGTFIEPTVLVQVRPDMACVREEIFGPVVVATPVDSLEEALALANDSIYGLAASVWTSDLSTAHRAAALLKSGTVWINCHLMFDASLPIGGVQQSGWGRESGQAAVENFLELKTVCAVV
ncbi:aldehyde dehydrogenase [Pseudorhodoferax sp. Leaf274]|uniref:aldehyde dehydrogenase family protein n=1 Tax=Pseudorhodoferax sp. Leaf274 TaxID=1736318 RepID=UPI000703A011|nr:aldehyde dehydrogenase family protein [Pseudorhodoferax sp. Leaf274]KQP46262.1 betaine-aldehyde dehydrogenase [Pseudorhodoferax sp. Leaf274]